MPVPGVSQQQQQHAHAHHAHAQQQHAQNAHNAAMAAAAHNRTVVQAPSPLPPPAASPVLAPAPLPSAQQHQQAQQQAQLQAQQQAQLQAQQQAQPDVSVAATSHTNHAVDHNGNQIAGNEHVNPPAGTENTGRWTAEEHRLFLQGLEQHGKGWKKIAGLIKSRTVVQIRTHAQKYFQKLAKARQNGEMGGAGVLSGGVNGGVTVGAGGVVVATGLEGMHPGAVVGMSAVDAAANAHMVGDKNGAAANMALMNGGGAAQRTGGASGMTLGSDAASLAAVTGAIGTASVGGGAKKRRTVPNGTKRRAIGSVVRSAVREGRNAKRQRLAAEKRGEGEAGGEGRSRSASVASASGPGSPRAKRKTKAEKAAAAAAAANDANKTTASTISITAPSPAAGPPAAPATTAPAIAVGPAPHQPTAPPATAGAGRYYHPHHMFPDFADVPNPLPSVSAVLDPYVQSMPHHHHHHHAAQAGAPPGAVPVQAYHPGQALQPYPQQHAPVASAPAPVSSATAAAPVAANKPPAANPRGRAQMVQTATHGTLPMAALEDAVFRLLTPATGAATPSATPPVGASAPTAAPVPGAPPVSDPLKIPYPNPVNSQGGLVPNSSPTCVTDLSSFPSWVDAKNPPHWYNEGADIDRLLEDAECLNWLDDTGDLEETYVAPPNPVSAASLTYVGEAEAWNDQTSAVAAPITTSSSCTDAPSLLSMSDWGDNHHHHPGVVSIETVGMAIKMEEPSPIDIGVVDAAGGGMVYPSAESLSFLVDPPEGNAAIATAPAPLPPAPVDDMIPNFLDDDSVMHTPDIVTEAVHPLDAVISAAPAPFASATEAVNASSSITAADPCECPSLLGSISIPGIEQHPMPNHHLVVTHPHQSMGSIKMSPSAAGIMLSSNDSTAGLMGFPDLDMGDEQAFVSALLDNTGQSALSFRDLTHTGASSGALGDVLEDHV